MLIRSCWWEGADFYVEYENGQTWCYKNAYFTQIDHTGEGEGVAVKEGTMYKRRRIE